MRKIVFLLSIVFVLMPVESQSRRDATTSFPPSWWVGMENNRVQIIIRGNFIGVGTATINYPGVIIVKQFPGYGRESNYLFVEIEISRTASPGVVPIIISHSGRTTTHNFQLQQRKKVINPILLNGTDVIYQIVPDRFANGDTSNDIVQGFFEQIDRTNPSAIHGGDILGITKNINYIEKLGVTAVNLTPIYETNQLIQSYDKFAPTNHYNIDPRLGTFEEFSNMVSALQNRHIKVLLTMVLNKMGYQHPFVINRPVQDWIYEKPDINLFITPNNTLFADPYASKEDLDLHYSYYWADLHIPALNHNIEHVRKFLIQNVIWWIETTQIDGIVLEDLQLCGHLLLKELCTAINKEYPKFNFIGIPNTDLVVHNHFWKDGLLDEQCFSHVSDYPLYMEVQDAFAEYKNTNDALKGVYKTLASDIIYDDPVNQLVIFCDGHDLTRLFTLAEKNMSVFKMYVGFLLTTRGIPSFLYGSEVIMEGLSAGGYGFVRGDFPGGWKGDTFNAFNPTTIPSKQREAYTFFTNLLDWRKNNPELMQSEIVQFEPTDDVYAYFRSAGNKKLLVIINNNPNVPRRMETNRFAKTVGKIDRAKDIITGEVYSGLGNLILNPKSILILELTNN